MNRFEKRKLKRNIYKHANTLMYVGIFLMASIITIAAAASRTDKITYVDNKQLAYSSKESVEMKNSSGPKVAATVTETAEKELNSNQEVTESITTTQHSETVSQTETTIQETTGTSDKKVTVTTDTLKVRAEASLEASVVGLASIDDEYEVISQNGEWIEIAFEETNGFVHSDFVEISE